jgi:SAM-dependent methyltransferase
VFDPQEWSRVYNEPQAGGKMFIFRRGCELALELCETLARPGQRWLDIGCGTGHLTAALHQTGACIIGADYDCNMIKFARQRTAMLVVAGAGSLPFADATLDGVVATSLIGCLPSPEKLFAETHRVLRDQGHAVMTFTNEASWLLTLNYLLANRPGRRESYRLHRAANVTRDLENIGFRISQVKFYNFVLHAGNCLLPPVALAKRGERLGCFKISHRLARNFIVVAQKAVP